MKNYVSRHGRGLQFRALALESKTLTGEFPQQPRSRLLELGTLPQVLVKIPIAKAEGNIPIHSQTVLLEKCSSTDFEYSILINGSIILS